MKVLLKFTQPLFVSIGSVPCKLKLKFENSTVKDDEKAYGFTSAIYGTEL